MASLPQRPQLSLADVVHALKEHKGPTTAATDEHPQDPPIPQLELSLIPPSPTPRQALKTPTRISRHHSSTSPRKSSVSGYRPPGTPSGRTGPPRSISYSQNYSISGSRHNSDHEEPGPSSYFEIQVSNYEETADPDFTSHFCQNTSPFRGVLDPVEPERKDEDGEDRKGKRRESYFPENWKPFRWIESPRPESKTFHESPDPNVGPQPDGTIEEVDEQTPPLSSVPVEERRLSFFRRTRSLPQMKDDTKDNRSSTTPGWTRLRSMLPRLVIQNRVSTAATPGPSVVTPPSVNITDELITGGLSTLMLRLWFERDEKGHRRVPILLHRLRIRVSDSLIPLHGHKAVFRIECEYANGAARWVIYRQLREIRSLHTHYSLSNAFKANVEKLPDFPKTSLPYFTWLKDNRDSSVDKTSFARLQREALENYLIDLIRAVMFHPSANRLAAFLEISAMSMALAHSGGTQYKAGFLRIESAGLKGLWGRKNTSWREKKRQKWVTVRESYLVVLEEMGELIVHDVFLLDKDFKIERPTRYYRQGLNLLTSTVEGGQQQQSQHQQHLLPELPNHDNCSHAGSTLGSIASRLSRTLLRRRRHPQGSAAGSTHRSNGHVRPPIGSDISSGDEFFHDLMSLDDSHAESHTLDPSTGTNPLHDQNTETRGPNTTKGGGDVSKHTFYVENSQMRLKLVAKNERQMLQWIAALQKAARDSHFASHNRFDSYAPIRLNVAAQWLVDGRDYFWNLSRAILLARESIYIHDWWLSPELRMRRPQMDKYRVDRLLEKKAKEGVKIYIIIYQEVSSRTTPTDSAYAKQRLTQLHPNIMVQRSPSHFTTGTFYWAHHEKICVIDHTIAFLGGLDLCFGRWDTPQHVLVDDPDLTSEGSEYIWPGKDYSNPRVMDFHALDRPDEDMYDRAKVPRMPWHDVSMQVVGQPSRDLARHFVQRWNYLLRMKNHKRQMPFLVPPPDFRPGELCALGLTGTCDLQICRSSGPWSMGTPVEKSIQNAYLKAIQMSEHFVYIENQFFITSTVVNEVKIENKIGDALVYRIIKAFREGTPWKCCIVIPLLPGFTFPVDHSDASAIRIILECQNRTLCRGPNSIYARLRKEGIDPDEYISVFSLRNWAKLRGDVLTTEQVYIHAKVCIVDDRLAIIGSANINERSQRGDRDSEIAAVIRDTDMIDCSMAGKPYKVGRFAHTLRVRLMREHLGIDVDAMYEDDLMPTEPISAPVPDQDEPSAFTAGEDGKDESPPPVGKAHKATAARGAWNDVVDSVKQVIHAADDVVAKEKVSLLHKTGLKNKVDITMNDASLDEERKTFTKEGEKVPGFTSSVVPTLEEKTVAEQRPPPERTERSSPEGTASRLANSSNRSSEWTAVEAEEIGEPASSEPRRGDKPGQHSRAKKDSEGDAEKASEVRATLRKHLASKMGSKPKKGTWTLPTPTPHVDPQGFEDPICDEFWKDIWTACAVHNTEIFRKVFHAIPDDLITTWKAYKEFIAHHERLNKPTREHEFTSQEPVARIPSEAGDVGAPAGSSFTSTNGDLHGEEPRAPRVRDFVEEPSEHTAGTHSGANGHESKGRKPPRGVEPFDQSERDEMERLLGELRGHLVVYPTRFLEGEDSANNFLFNADRLLPLPIYD